MVASNAARTRSPSNSLSGSTKTRRTSSPSGGRRKSVASAMASRAGYLAKVSPTARAKHARTRLASAEPRRWDRVAAPEACTTCSNNASPVASTADRTLDGRSRYMPRAVARLVRVMAIPTFRSPSEFNECLGCSGTQPTHSGTRDTLREGLSQEPKRATRDFS